MDGCICGQYLIKNLFSVFNETSDCVHVCSTEFTHSVQRFPSLNDNQKLCNLKAELTKAIDFAATCKASFSCTAVKDSLANILHLPEEVRTDILLVERILDVPHHMSISGGRGESLSIK